MGASVLMLRTIKVVVEKVRVDELDAIRPLLRIMFFKSIYIIINI